MSSGKGELEKVESETFLELIESGRKIKQKEVLNLNVVHWLTMNTRTRTLHCVDVNTEEEPPKGGAFLPRPKLTLGCLVWTTN